MVTVARTGEGSVITEAPVWTRGPRVRHRLPRWWRRHVAEDDSQLAPQTVSIQPFFMNLDRLVLNLNRCITT